MKRFLIAAALAAALLVPATFGPTPAAASDTSCDSQTIGTITYTSCYGPHGAYSSGSNLQIGNTGYGSYSGRDSNGQNISGSGTTTRIGSQTWTDWNTYP